MRRDLTVKTYTYTYYLYVVGTVQGVLRVSNNLLLFYSKEIEIFSKSPTVEMNFSGFWYFPMFRVFPVIVFYDFHCLRLKYQ